MLINSIEKVSKDRRRLNLDSGESFVLYAGEIRIMVLKEGEELPEETYRNIIETILPRRAKLRMLALLKQRSYTESQLKDKLITAGYPESVVAGALEYVKAQGYVDDYAYALDFIEYHSDRHNKREIVTRLTTKGIRPDIIEKAINEACNDDGTKGGFDEKPLVVKTLKKRGYTGNETYEERQKLLAYFYRRGFSMDVVYAAMDECRGSD